MGERIAAIDCGTNSIKILIGEPPQVMVRESRMVRLGQGVDTSGVLAEEALARTFAAIDEYAALIRRHDVARVRFCATSATRDAKQARKFIGRTVVEGKPYLIPRFSAAAPTEATSGRIEEMAMYCGLSCGAISGGKPAAEIVADFARILQGVEIFETGTG